MSDNEEILFAVDDGIMRVTLNRPEMGNAVTQDQRARLAEWIERANEDHSIRCVVIGATGRFFCTGADLRTQREPVELPEGQPERVVGDTRRMMTRGAIATVSSILDCEKPVIAAVQGTAAGHRMSHRVRVRSRRSPPKTPSSSRSSPAAGSRSTGWARGCSPGSSASSGRRSWSCSPTTCPRSVRSRSGSVTRVVPAGRARGDRRRARPPAGRRAHEGAHGEQVVAEPLVRRRPKHARG